ncbi:GALNT [Lepeophtheirus salmonis]|uniref:Polypeptide N-acetylgalactosaminyltransferase n=1 Tax=Lepeophtheirus salmonis TaxID=72036 RepID=A0A7R8H5L6_LEPSM|nr:GALNT [Lepeophtheirus salmonis]CAF2885709.1 GALNT [Lepeophtheirus salmonis]
MVGIKESKAPILTFLDSHIEASKGWLEPLLHSIKNNPQLITSPVIDSINDTTFYYTFIYKDLYGLMNWKLDFEWRELSEQEIAKKENIWAPHKNPIMAGGLFSIRKDWFETLGFYDEGMSRFPLAHELVMSSETHSPYRVTPDDINKNGIRVAKVWMDEFQYLFYERLGAFNKKGEERLISYGDVSKRQELRDKLGCNSFKWFLDNIGKSELPYHSLIGSGEIKNPSTGGIQGSTVIVAHCQMSGTWNYDPNKKILRHSSGRCLTAGSGVATVDKCNPSDPNQQWEFTRYNKLGLDYENLF